MYWYSQFFVLFCMLSELYFGIFFCQLSWIVFNLNNNPFATFISDQIYFSTFRSSCLFLNLSFFLSFSLSFCYSVRLSVFLSISSFSFPSVHLSFLTSLSLSVFLYLFHFPFWILMGTLFQINWNMSSDGHSLNEINPPRFPCTF